MQMKQNINAARSLITLEHYIFILSNFLFKKQKYISLVGSYQIKFNIKLTY